MTLIFRSSSENPPVSQIKQLCHYSKLSIGEVRARAAASEPLLSIAPFENTWQDDRKLLAELANAIANETLPMEAFDCDDEDDEGSPMAVDELINQIRHYREIELQDQRDEDLRMGTISDPAEFEPHDEDWTRI